MKICVAQTKPVRGDIGQNIVSHQKLIDLAVSNGADMIFFPELSLTGYELTLAEALATAQNDSRLDCFQNTSDDRQITIGVGLPTRGELGLLISMVIFQPQQPRQTYSKQILHTDELPYFVGGQQQVVLKSQNKTVAPAICYESLQPEHAAGALEKGANIYLASVAKSASGIDKAGKHYPEIAKKYSIPVLMSNCTGPCDDFESVGQSAVWNQHGVRIEHLGTTAEGILLYDTETEKVLKFTTMSSDTVSASS